ncbi:MAG: amidohydrolase family protein [Alphaproteobacteria bacterium]|nr:amidohydrolase family protein [Alphaproteobacteria bacterium]
MRVIFRNAAVFDGHSAHRRPGCDVVVEGGVIREVADRPVTLADAKIFDLRGRTLMPGLIDCHVHVTATMLDLGANARVPHTLQAYKVMPILRGMLERGFTSVRDAGGADYALSVAIDTGIVAGPRLFLAGQALSQTGGHADFRGRWDENESPCGCCRRLGRLGRVVDGVDACRQAVREEIKAGASQIKVMASGGVASPTDPIGFTGFSEDELTAICAEAAAAETYVMAHAYTAKAIQRAVTCGVRTIEHGNLVDRPAAETMAAHGAYAVPTLVTYDALAEHGAGLGFPPESVAKIENVRGAGLRSLEIFKHAGVKMAYGSDLLGELHVHQSEEFALRTRVLSNVEVLQQATSTAAEVLRMEGRLGTIHAGAIADILVVDGDPLADIEVLRHQGRHLDAVMKAGVFFKNRLA